MTLISGVVRSPIRGLTSPKGVGVPGPYPAPSGYRWAYVVEDSVRVTEDGQPVVDLERLAA